MSYLAFKTAIYVKHFPCFRYLVCQFYLVFWYKVYVSGNWGNDGTMNSLLVQFGHTVWFVY